MVNDDTIRLLRECDAGVRMGVGSIEDVLGDVQSERMRAALMASDIIDALPEILKNISK